MDPRESVPPARVELDAALHSLGLDDAETLEARNGEMTAREVTTGSVLGLSAFGIVVVSGAAVVASVLTLAAVLFVPLVGWLATQ